MLTTMKAILATLSAILAVGVADSYGTFGDGSDLSFFLSAPNIRPPKFNITYLDESRISPGYWFLGPYDFVKQDPKSSKLEPCQVGPTMYDNHGQLVWSGACDLENGNVYNFNSFERDGKRFLSILFRGRSSLFKDQAGTDHRGVGITLDESYRAVDFVHTRKEDDEFNMHEFLVTKANTALIILGVPTETELPPSLGANGKTLWAWLGGFREVEIDTNAVLFDWQLLDHISLDETVKSVPADTSSDYAWDWFHPNSIDKDPDGNYLFSGRFTDTIYKIAGSDKSILWRLGGRNSSFELDGFNFSRQHDARFLSRAGSKLNISMLNNGGDGQTNSAVTSSGLIVELDEEHMTARLVSQWLRPDGQLSPLRGNVQVLESGHTFIAWSENGYISEYTPQGEMVLNAQFASKRLTTYRAFKAPFVGKPQYPPSLVSYAHGLSPESTTTTIHVSWNGATEIESWAFYGSDSLNGTIEKLGNVKKIGFETTFTAPSFQPWAYAEALDSNGVRIGGSPREKTAIPLAWGRPKTGVNTTAKAAYLSGWHHVELNEIDLGVPSYTQDQTLASKFDGAIARLKSTSLISLIVGIVVGSVVTLGALHFMSRVHKIKSKSANGGSYQLVSMNGHEES